MGSELVGRTIKQSKGASRQSSDEDFQRFARGLDHQIALSWIQRCHLNHSATTLFILVTMFSGFHRLHRQPKHLLDFLLAELGTSGSVDGNSQLIIKGRFQQKQIENVLRRYIKEYVTCHTCRSPDTILQKDTRLFFLQCETCGSRCSVASIKSGFQVSLKSRLLMQGVSEIVRQNFRKWFDGSKSNKKINV